MKNELKASKRPGMQAVQKNSSLHNMDCTVLHEIRVVAESVSVLGDTEYETTVLVQQTICTSHRWSHFGKNLSHLSSLKLLSLQELHGKEFRL